MALRTPSPGDDRTEIRVGRRSLERRPPGGTWRDIRSVGFVVAVAIASMVVVIAVLAAVLGPARFTRSATSSGSASGESGGPPTIDVEVENLIAAMTDGRQARGTYTLRLREAQAPRQLIEATRRTPTPEKFARPGVPKPPTDLNPTESLVRDTVNATVARLSYEETKGAEGKQVLKDVIRESVNTVLPGAPVVDVFVREYVVQ